MMKSIVKRGSVILVVALFAVLPGLAQQPRLVNAKLRNVPVGTNLEQAVRAAIGSFTGPGWIGYAVPAVAGRHSMCCTHGDDNNNCWRCTLEGGRSESSTAVTPAQVQLEARHFFVLMRAEGGRVMKIRSYSADCELDVGGLETVWLTGVNPAQSVALLSAYVGGSEDDKERSRMSESAVSAIALHEHADAGQALERFVATGNADRVRRNALFWLGAARGRRGFEVVTRVAREDASDKLREHATFVLTVTSEPEAIPTLINLARRDSSSRVRGQALFWLAQKAGKRAAEAITDAIENDPETEVKRRAVFALSQLPKDEGVPLLIQVARTNRNPAVRKQAMFWLGQSKDPRAVDFFEQLLTAKK